MPDEPYRPPPPGAVSPEVARLAAEGQHQILEASAGDAVRAQKAEEKNLRVALGAHYGAPVTRASYGIIAVAAVLMGGQLVWHEETLVLGILMLQAGVVLRIFATPTATRARVAAERAWVTALPFQLDGYIDALAATPRFECHLETVLTWADARLAPDGDTVSGVLGVLDTAARVESSAEGKVTIRSGPISGNTGIRVNRVRVYRNTRQVAYVHGLVEKVLLPLHRSHAITRVSLTRW